MDIIACLRPSIDNLKSDFYVGFRFSVPGVIYIGRWIYEGCVISVLCEKLFVHHSVTLIGNEWIIGYHSMPKTLNS